MAVPKVSNEQIKVYNIFSYIAIVLGIVAIGLCLVLYAPQAASINSLGGVGYVTTPVDGEVLTYDAELGMWVNRGVPAVDVPDVAAYGFGNLTDSTVADPVDGQMIVFNASAGGWVNVAVPADTLVQCGVSPTSFSLNNTGYVVEDFNFSKPFVSTPVVVVGLGNIVGGNSTVVDVQAVNVTPTGFTAMCRVSQSEVNGLARFTYIATT